MKNPQPEPQSLADPSRKRRKLRVLLFSLLSLGLLLFVAISGLSYYGYTRRVALLNEASERFDLPFDISIENLFFLGTDTIQFVGVEARDNKTGRLALRSEQTTWQFKLWDLKNGNFGKLALHTAQLALTPEDIELLKGAEPSSRDSIPSPAKTPNKSRRTGFILDAISLQDFAFSYSGDSTIPALAGTLDWEGDSLSFSEAKGFLAASQKLRFTDLVIDGKTPDKLEPAITAVFPALRIELTEATNERFHFHQIEVAADAFFGDLEALLHRFNGDPARTKDGDRHHPATVVIDKVSLSAESLHLVAIDTPEHGPIAFAGGLTIAASDLVVRGNEGAIGKLCASVTDAQVDVPLHEGTDFACAEIAIDAHASWGEKATQIEISHLALSAPILALNLSATDPEKKPANFEPTQKKPSPSQQNPAPFSVSLGDLQIQKAKLALSRDHHQAITQLTADFAVMAKDWEWRSDRPGRLPDSLQTLEIDTLEATFAGAEAPARLAGLKLQIAPGQFTKAGIIHSLAVARVDVDLSGAELLEAIRSNEEVEITATSEPPARALDPSQWVFTTLQIASGHLHIPAIPTLGIPDIAADIAISTPQGEALPHGVHDVSLFDIAVSADQEDPPFYRSEGITARIDCRKIWEGSCLTALRIGKGTLEIGDAIAGMFSQEEATAGEEEPAEAPDPAAMPADDPLAKLFPDLAEVAIADTRIILKNIAPGLHTVIFGLKKKPGKQRIELAQIEITSPYNPLLPVARLDTIFIEFTLAGLLQQRIKKIEIVSPTIFVGENLFWFIEHYRSNGKEEEKENNEEGGDKQGWDINEIHAHNGKLVIAPKGMPIPGLEVPFPFSCRTQLGRGVIEATLAIQNADYAIPDIEILLEDLEGTVEFNLPIKQLDNNLVQVLKAKKLRFRQLEGEDPWVSFTYDQHGIYTRFGAKSYGGYVEGAANVYIDDDYTWDAWAAMTDLETGPVTEVLTPTYFRMQGRSDATVIASGNISELFQASGTFSSPDGGEIDIRALDGLENNIEAASPITLWLAEAGVDLLQHFRYDTAEGKFSLYGREGELDFLLAGPDGRREFEVMVHDSRPFKKLKPSS